MRSLSEARAPPTPDPSPPLRGGRGNRAVSTLWKISMPKIDISKIPSAPIPSYPKEFAHVISGRHKQRIGDGAGLTQFGVNITRIEAGSASALRHWHEQEDEFIYMLEGELVLRENDGEWLLKPGDAAGFKAGSGIGHCLVNRGTRDAVYLEIGTGRASER